MLQNREYHLSCWRFIGTSWPDLCGQLQQQSIPRPSSLQQLTTPLSHLAFKNALVKPFGELSVLGAWTTPSPCKAYNKLLCSKFWCFRFFFVCLFVLASLCIWHRNLQSVANKQCRNKNIVFKIITHHLFMWQLFKNLKWYKVISSKRQKRWIEFWNFRT